jgi:hypothetical protein
MQTETALLAANVAVYASVALGLFMGGRRRKAPPAAGDDAMFNQIESALQRRLPRLPDGFTMREGLSSVRSIEPDLAWDQIEKSLEGYEAYRYGGGPPPSGERPELAKLIQRLRGSW